MSVDRLCSIDWSRVVGLTRSESTRFAKSRSAFAIVGFRETKFRYKGS